jgi:hypothetical protein
MLSIALRNEHLHAEVLPEAGAGLARLDWITGPVPVPLFRPLALAAGAPPPTPSQLACFPMLPWANRIDPAGFEFEGMAGSIRGRSRRNRQAVSPSRSTAALERCSPTPRSCVGS